MLLCKRVKQLPDRKQREAENGTPQIHVVTYAMFESPSHRGEQLKCFLRCEQARPPSSSLRRRAVKVTTGFFLERTTRPNQRATCLLEPSQPVPETAWCPCQKLYSSVASVCKNFRRVTHTRKPKEQKAQTISKIESRLIRDSGPFLHHQFAVTILYESVR